MLGRVAPCEPGARPLEDCLGVLASDAERAETVEQLSRHCAYGRLTLEEFEKRAEAALAARTVEELQALLEGLPREVVRPEPQRPAVGPPGLWPFTMRTEISVGADRVRAGLLEHIAPGLNRYGYELRHQSPTSLVFERRGRPGWVPFVAVLLFPVGLVALAFTETQRLAIALEELGPSRTALTVYGRRRARCGRRSPSCRRAVGHGRPPRLQPP
jgi:Domain of unknown function (DUF1707)